MAFFIASEMAVEEEFISVGLFDAGKGGEGDGDRDGDGDRFIGPSGLSVGGKRWIESALSILLDGAVKVTGGWRPGLPRISMA